MLAQRVLSLADVREALRNLFPADGDDLATRKPAEFGHHRMPVGRIQPLLAAQRAGIVVVRGWCPVLRNVIHEFVDGLKPAPGRSRALAADALLMGNGDASRELGNEFLGIQTTPAPALHLARAVAGGIRLDIGTTDDPASLRAIQPGADRPRDCTAADTKLKPRTLRIGEV